MMHQVWAKLLFLHWAFPPEVIRPLVPPRLTLDTFDGLAYVGVIPFTMWGLRPHGFPAPPILGKTHEINVRTYVHADGVPGVWFFSLDASNPLAVIGARAGFALPYFQASIRLREEGSRIRYASRRTHPGAPRADFAARWRGGEELGEADPGTLEFFLVERYCLYARRGRRLYRSRVHHPPWPLRAASLEMWTSTMLEAQGIDEPLDPPHVLMQAAPVDVEVWPREEV